MGPMIKLLNTYFSQCRDLSAQVATQCINISLVLVEYILSIGAYGLSKAIGTIGYIFQTTYNTLLAPIGYGLGVIAQAAYSCLYFVSYQITQWIILPIGNSLYFGINVLLQTLNTCSTHLYYWVLSPISYGISIAMRLAGHTANFLAECVYHALLNPVYQTACLAWSTIYQAGIVIQNYIFNPIVSTIVWLTQTCLQNIIYPIAKACEWLIKICLQNIFTPIARACEWAVCFIGNQLYNLAYHLHLYVLSPILQVTSWAYTALYHGVLQPIGIFTQWVGQSIIQSATWALHKFTMANIIYSIQIVLSVVLHPFLGLTLAISNPGVLPLFTSIGVSTAAISGKFFLTKIQDTWNTHKETTTREKIMAVS